MTRQRQELQERSRRRQPVLGARLGNWLAFGVLLVAAIIWLILAWAVDTALKTEADTTVIPISWIPPSGFTFESFVEVLSAGNMLRWYFNSALTSSAITVIVVALASLAAFGISRVPFRGRSAVFWIILAGLMVPPQVLIVPLFTEMDFFGLIDTYPGIILPQIASRLRFSSSSCSSTGCLTNWKMLRGLTERAASGSTGRSGCPRRGL